MAGERYASLTFQHVFPGDGQQIQLWLGGAYRTFTARYGYTVATREYTVYTQPNAAENPLLSTANSLRYAIEQELTRLGLADKYQLASTLVRDTTPEDADGDGYVDDPSVDSTGMYKGQVSLTARYYDAALDFQPLVDGGFGTPGNDYPRFREVSRLATAQTVIVEPAVTLATCWGSATGTILLRVRNGSTGQYTYLWNDGSTEKNRFGIRAGQYSVTVTDASGANTTVTVRVGQNTQIVLDIRKENGGLSVFPSGGVGPYTYLWNDGIRTAVRPNLAAGIYTCVVKDSLGCGAQISASVEQNRFFFSHDPIELRLDAGDDYRDDPTTKPNLSFVCSVHVEREYLSGHFELAGQPQEQPADRDGRTVFEVQELLEPFVDCQFPAVAGGLVPDIVQARRNFCRFYLSYQERVDGELSAGITSELSYLVHGGLSFEEAARGTWFNGFQDVQKPFLTWEPLRKRVTREQPEWLYLLVPADTTSVVRQVRVYLSDGSSPAFALGRYDDVRRHEVYILPCSFAALDLGRFELSAVRVLRWEVWASDQDGSPVSEVRTYELDGRYQHTPRYFLYGNSLGGVNTLPAFGRSDVQLATKTTSSQLVRVAGYDAERGDVQVDRKTGLPTLKVYAGPRSREQLQADQDFMLSPRVVLYDGERLQAGTVKDRTFTPYDEDETRRLLPFDFELPRQRHYTPRLRLPVQSTPIETPPIVPPVDAPSE
ncbi:SprB repeat-containing protein [Hymenobacter pini]|uniref:SprB repeat-containing protein n=1 Tax=Hymenobacter pini TaxID=2880879 RepID=UPI001CF36663|nr:SprB repeat-containing protein [Hymenobacter pini]MCA8830190.1 SprB repeat-containing protein [Hymenobacter pini]